MLDMCLINPLLIFMAAVIVEIALIILTKRKSGDKILGFTLIILLIMLWATYAEYNEVVEERNARFRYEQRVRELCGENSTFMREFEMNHPEIPESRIKDVCREYITFNPGSPESGAQRECGMESIKLTTYAALFVSLVVLVFAALHDR